MSGAANRARSARLPGLDALKGLAIVCVVAIHAAPFAPEIYLQHFVGGVARLAVPLFLTITGFLHGRRGCSREAFRRYFLVFLRLHVVYGLFYWAFELALRGPPESVSLKWALLHFGAGSFAGQFYLAVLLQVMFLAAFVVPTGFWRSGGALALSCVAAGAGILALFQASTAQDPGSVLSLLARLRGNPFWLWLVYFHLGTWLGARQGTGRGLDVVPAGALAIAALALATSGLPLVTSVDFVAAFPYARASVLLGGVALALAVPTLATLGAPGPLLRLGRRSFAVFVLNPAIVTVLAEAFGQPASPLASWLLVAVTIPVALGIAGGMRRFAPIFLP